MVSYIWSFRRIRINGSIPKKISNVNSFDSHDGIADFAIVGLRFFGHYNGQQLLWIAFCGYIEFFTGNHFRQMFSRKITRKYSGIIYINDFFPTFYYRVGYFKFQDNRGKYRHRKQFGVFLEMYGEIGRKL